MTELVAHGTGDGNESVTELLRKRSAQSVERTFADFLTGEVDVLKGRRVVGNKDELAGVPFAITAVHFYPGIGGTDFAALEIQTVHDEELVLNDGSTGIRRQIVDYLTHRGLVDTGGARVIAVEVNGKGKKLEIDDPLDVPATHWAKGNKNEEGKSELAAFDLMPRPFVCPAGLRVSRYTNEFGESATYYLA